MLLMRHNNQLTVLLEHGSCPQHYKQQTQHHGQAAALAPAITTPPWSPVTSRQTLLPTRSSFPRRERRWRISLITLLHHCGYDGQWRISSRFSIQRQCCGSTQHQWFRFARAPKSGVHVCTCKSSSRTLNLLCTLMSFLALLTSHRLTFHRLWIQWFTNATSYQHSGRLTGIIITGRKGGEERVSNTNKRIE
jgi:hypothetical protein